MLIQIDDHVLVTDLCAHFTRSGFTAGPVGGGMIEVERPDWPANDHDGLAVLQHLRVWEVVNPGVAITRVT